MKKIIEFKKVSYRYQFEEKFAIEDINLEIYEGEVLAIIGSNGAGKTTLIKHMNGLLKPTIGDVYVEGLNTKNVTVAELSRKVGIVFQNADYQLFAQTVYDEIAFALKNFGFEEEEIKKRVDNVLEYFSLKQYVENSPLLLSGGEKKRVALASVLVYDPKVLILDEPTIGLDFVQKKNLKNLISDMKNRNKTIIIVTHDLDFVAEIAERVVVMKNGRILRIDSSREIFYDEDLLTNADLITPSIVRITKGLGIKDKLLSLDEVLERIDFVIRNVQG
ncbi:MAG: ATP-binding cassette domain-containing protein [Thermoproteota archaeon]|jgi:energy-coupling factor transport system ATP-binding protein|nr:ATP-binding cassette domain-containing protein [Thermoproteota archaeon]